MKLSEFIKTCTNDVEGYNIYFDDESWDDLVPDVEVYDKQDLHMALVSMNRAVRSWFIDANWVLHILV